MRTLLFITAAATVLLTASPAHADTMTTYQPAAQSSRHTGYSETVIDTNRLRVAFRGNSGASRESVETNLLYRASELTLSRGYDFFVVVDHSVDTDVQVQTVGPPMPPIAPRRYRSEARFIATSDIMMFRGVRPLNVPAAFDARTVQANLITQIRRPR
jgi:hypothetical protein